MSKIKLLQPEKMPKTPLQGGTHSSLTLFSTCPVFFMCFSSLMAYEPAVLTVWPPHESCLAESVTSFRVLLRTNLLSI